jgi:ribosomal protein S18 acetylase RimI-like enzyme
MSQEVVPPAGAPEVPGLTLRLYGGDQDLPLMVEVFEAVSTEDGLEWVLTVDRLRKEYENTPGFDPRRDVVLAQVEGRTVGYGQVRWFQEVDGPFSTAHRVRVVPAWRGKGVARTLMAVIEERAREMAATHAQGPWKMGTVVAAGEEHLLALMEASGFERERWYLELTRDLSEPIETSPMPEGIEIRSTGEADQRRVFEAMWEAFRGGYAFREMTEKDWTGFTVSPEFQPQLWVVGWDGDQVAGSVMCWIDEVENSKYGRLWGYNDSVAVSEPYRRRGLARALVSQSLVLLRDRGMEFANLGVDTQNPADALGLYEGLGYRVRKKFIDLTRPMG